MENVQKKMINRLSDRYISNVRTVYENALKSFNLELMLNMLKEYNYLDFNLLYKAIIENKNADMAVAFFKLFITELNKNQITTLLTIIENDYKKGMFYQINRAFYRLNLDDDNQLSYLMEKLALKEKNTKPENTFSNN